MIPPSLHPLAPRPCRILRVLAESHDTFTLELQAGDESAGCFKPGQFNMLYVFGVGEVPISVSGDPTRPERLVHTTREAGAVTQAMRRLRKGECIGVRGPFGTPWPIDRASGKDVLLIAGGIGLAPLRPALYDIAARRKDFGTVTLLYGTRSPEDMLFRRELQRWSMTDGIEVLVTVDRAIGAWPGHVGVVTGLIPQASFEPTNTIVLICGPEVMMRFSAEGLRRRGVPQDAIYLSMERNMKCALGFCGHCQFGPSFVCKDGPVFAYERVKRLLEVREV
jgi:NAD(P)H-flavin reductase